jgi:thioester reductase-like protein
MANVLFTGFPGFLGSALLPRVLARDPAARAVCLVHPKAAALARERVQALRTLHPGIEQRMQLVEGDITVQGLGMSSGARALLEATEEVYHLAAAYDLSVDRATAQRVNVDGTRNVLDVAASVPALRRVHYVSTCYVSGAHRGVYREGDLEVGQPFHNAYEATKFEAEVDVRRRMAAGMPATIYRPAIVVGDSRTGETQKYDGPYFGMRLLLRQPRVAVLPVIGDVTRHRLNVVPRDFVVDAITTLSALATSVGRTYHLADPAPLTVDEVFTEIARAAGRRLVRVPVPLAVAKWSLDHVPGVYRLMQTPAAALDYQVHPTTYDTTQATQDLAGSGVACPPFTAYVDRLVAFVRANPDVGSAAMM